MITDEDEISDFNSYAAATIDSNLFQITIAEKNHMVIGSNFGNYTLFDIETFVKEILNNQFPAFKIIHQKEKVEIVPLNLSKYFNYLDKFINEYSEWKIFSPHVTLFFNSAVHFGLMEGSIGKYEKLPDLNHKKLFAEIFNGVVDKIRIDASTSEFKKAVYSREYEFKRNFKSATKYVDALFERYSRLLILRVDLGFFSIGSIATKKVTLNEAKEHLKRLLNNRRTNKVFENVVGYIWKLEHGNEKGYHFHMFFFIDGSKSYKDEHRAYMIGEYWQKVTCGVGYFYNCNLNKSRYPHGTLAIGMVSHFDLEMRGNIKRVLCYFFKKEQFLKEKFRENDRMFGKGEMPSSKKSNAGRKRKFS